MTVLCGRCNQRGSFHGALCRQCFYFPAGLLQPWEASRQCARKGCTAQRVTKSHCMRHHREAQRIRDLRRRARHQAAA